MDSLEKRAKNHDFGVFVVPSTLEVVADRAERMFLSGRPMNYMEWYDRTMPTADFVKVVPGLSLDERIEVPFKRWSGDKLNGPGFSVYLNRLVTFSVGTELGETEESARARFNTDSPTDITYISFVGGREDDWGDDDKISLTYCNSHGVRTHTVVAFAREIY